MMYAPLTKDTISCIINSNPITVNSYRTNDNKEIALDKLLKIAYELLYGIAHPDDIKQLLITELDQSIRKA